LLLSSYLFICSATAFEFDQSLSADDAIEWFNPNAGFANESKKKKKGKDASSEDADWEPKPKGKKPKK
jgi:hypothetical protein